MSVIGGYTDAPFTVVQPEHNALKVIYSGCYCDKLILMTLVHIFFTDYIGGVTMQMRLISTDMPFTMSLVPYIVVLLLLCEKGLFCEHQHTSQIISR